MEMDSRPFRPPPSKFVSGNGSNGASGAGGPDGPVHYNYEPFDWKKYFKKKKYIPYWIGLIVILVLVVLITVFHKQIVHWLKPVSIKIRSKKWGFIIPILILIAISFPPLFGHEIIAILCGVVYGLWVGFAIVAAGTFLGEIATYFCFKTVFRKKAEKLERTNLNYAALATITREGGFLVVFVTRLSAIPSHFTTAVFATCGVKFWIFLVATFASLPKQLVTVYIGILLENPGGSKLASDIVLVVTFLVTLGAAVYIYREMGKVRPRLLAASQQSDYETDQAFSHEYNPGYTTLDNPGNPPTTSPLLTQGQQYEHAQQNTAYEPMRTELPGGRPAYGEGYGDQDSHYGNPNVRTDYATHPVRQDTGKYLRKTLPGGTYPGESGDATELPDPRHYGGNTSGNSSRVELGPEVRPMDMV